MTVKGGSATRAGVMILPAVACMVPASIVASQLITRTGSYRWAIWSGWVMTTVACALLTIFKLNTSVAVRAVIGSLFGLGGGFVILAVSAGIQAMTREDDSAMAACMYGKIKFAPSMITSATDSFQHSSVAWVFPLEFK